MPNEKQNCTCFIWTLTITAARQIQLVRPIGLFSQARYERLIRETPWSLFVETIGEYDEFQDFDFRITAHAGVGYWLFQNQSGIVERPDLVAVFRTKSADRRTIITSRK